MGERIKEGIAKICFVGGQHQVSDISTKSLLKELFCKFRSILFDNCDIQTCH